MKLIGFFSPHRFLALILLYFCPLPADSHGSENRILEAGHKLLTAYPHYLREVRENSLVWRDGTVMPLDDGKGTKDFLELLDTPDLEDMFAMPYPKGQPSPPALNQDPGRVRFQPFFEKMYGRCAHNGSHNHLVSIAWLKSKGGGTVKVSRLNDIAKKVSAISEELEKLPGSYDEFLLPIEGGYFCRIIEGTKRLSPHSYGIAIDLGVKKSNYWRWQTSAKSTSKIWHNSIPYEIIKIFENHGFIWGGRWFHYDTMHFEYRPELLTE